MNQIQSHMERKYETYKDFQGRLKNAFQWHSGIKGLNV